MPTLKKNLDFSDKFRTFRDIIDKALAPERSGAEAWTQPPLPATITEKLGYGPKRRNSRIAKCREIYFI